MTLLTRKDGQKSKGIEDGIEDQKRGTRKGCIKQAREECRVSRECGKKKDNSRVAGTESLSHYNTYARITNCYTSPCAVVCMSQVCVD